jgi:hypothetical protein
MAKVIVSLATGRSVTFDVDEHATGPACFVLGIRKCGSSMLNIICVELAAKNGRNFVGVDRFFYADVREVDYIKDPAIAVLLHPGNVYGGFRMMPAGYAGHEIFRRGPKILMVRDPRDALVSQYYSNAFSHPIPRKSAPGAGGAEELELLRRHARLTEIDKFVLNHAADLQRAFLHYEWLKSSPTAEIVRYEDFVFRKPDLIRLIARHFGWTVTDDQIDEIMVLANIVPMEEDPTAFVRQVTPGDHRKKLRQETIDKLNVLLAPALSCFGYATD